jgi:Flp pilus assembly protein TadG
MHHSAYNRKAARRRERRKGRGQATVEFALLLPMVAICMILLIQVAFLGLQRVLVTHAAREGARIAATGASPERVTARVKGATQLDSERFKAETSRAGDLVTVTVRYRAAISVPLIGHLVTEPEFVETIVMRREGSGTADRDGG